MLGDIKLNSRELLTFEIVVIMLGEWFMGAQTNRGGRGSWQVISQSCERDNNLRASRGVIKTDFGLIFCIRHSKCKQKWRAGSVIHDLPLDPLQNSPRTAPYNRADKKARNNSVRQPLQAKHFCFSNRSCVFWYTRSLARAWASIQFQHRWSRKNIPRSSMKDYCKLKSLHEEKRFRISKISFMT